MYRWDWGARRCGGCLAPWFWWSGLRTQQKGARANGVRSLHAELLGNRITFSSQAFPVASQHFANKLRVEVVFLRPGRHGHSDGVKIPYGEKARLALSGLFDRFHVGYFFGVS